MPRYKLRTLLILLAILPPLLWIGWGKYQAWKAEQERLKAQAAEQERFATMTGYYPNFKPNPKPKAPAKAGE